MQKENIVFIARSIDGYIADKNGGIDWLNSIENPEGIDMGYGDLINRIDAIIMGRNTFETVLSFGIDWPYSKPVFVLSNNLKSLPDAYSDKAELLKGSLKVILKEVNSRGYNKLYIDGGRTVQNFLKEDLIDELITSTIPIILGDGIPLFSKLDRSLNFEHKYSKVYLNQVVQDCYLRKRENVNSKE